MKPVELKSRKYGASGNVVVIIHGLFGSADNWMSIAKRLSDRFQVYCVDLRNHGRSPWADPHTYDAMAEDLHHFFKTLDTDQIHVIGHSMGGKAVMRFAQLHTSTVDQMAVIDIGPKFYDIHHRSILDAYASIDLQALKSRSQADELLKPRIENWSVRQFLLKNLYKDPKNQQWRWKINVKLLSEQIANVGQEVWPEEHCIIPTLFIRGENSNYILEEDIDEIRSQYIYSNVVTIPNAGHWVHAEQPDLLEKEIREFFI